MLNEFVTLKTEVENLWTRTQDYFDENQSKIETSSRNDFINKSFLLSSQSDPDRVILQQQCEIEFLNKLSKRFII